MTHENAHLITQSKGFVNVRLTSPFAQHNVMFKKHHQGHLFSEALRMRCIPKVLTLLTHCKFQRINKTPLASRPPADLHFSLARKVNYYPTQVRPLKNIVFIKCSHLVWMISFVL